MAKCYGLNQTVKEQKGWAEWAVEESGRSLKRAGLADVGFPRLPSGFYWGKEFINVNNPTSSEKKKLECCRQWWGGGPQGMGESIPLRETQMIYILGHSLGTNGDRDL